MEIFIPQFVRTALDRLNECGYEGYIVGGCVRDSLLGKKPHDYDVCTNCTPDKMLEVFANFRTIETGLKHGTLTVLIESEPVEITCYRSDGEYIGHRKPAQVTFESSLEEDLKRRDFTVNAMAYSPKEGLIDLYGGQGDLEKGIIKCVGEPEKRFDEDALRILRGLRFSSCLGFEIEEKTSKAILEQRELLKSISAERIASELKKLLCGKGARKILLDYREVIAVFIPELRESFDFRQNNPHHFLDVYGHICLSVENVRPQWQMRLTMLLHDIGKPRMHTVDENGISHFKKHQFQGAYTVSYTHLTLPTIFMSLYGSMTTGYLPRKNRCGDLWLSMTLTLLWIIWRCAGLTHMPSLTTNGRKSLQNLTISQSLQWR